VATSTVHSTAKMAENSPLYLHCRWDAFECLGCGAMIEIPTVAILKAGGRPVRVRGNPENLLCWREAIAVEHVSCESFIDLWANLESALCGSRQ
jgi:hypothetical protein